MAGYDGNGNFLLTNTFETDRINNIDVRSDRMDANMNDIISGMELGMTVDGQTTVTDNIPFNSNKITGLGNATGIADAANLGQIRGLTGLAFTTTGSANAYVLTPAPSLSAYAENIQYYIEANFTNTAAVTIAVSGLATRAIQDSEGLALVGGEITSGNRYRIIDDGSAFRIQDVHTLIKAAGLETIFIPAAAMLPTASNGCATIVSAETTSGRPDMVVLDFDATADEFAQFQWPFPKSYDLGTVTFIPHWTTASTNTGTVEWDLQAVAVSNDGTIDVVYGTLQTSTDSGSGTAEDLHVGPESSDITIAGTPAFGDMTFFRIGRDATVDTHTSDARLIGIDLFWTTDKRNDT